MFINFSSQNTHVYIFLPPKTYVYIFLSLKHMFTYSSRHMIYVNIFLSPLDICLYIPLAKYIRVHIPSAIRYIIKYSSGQRHTCICIRILLAKRQMCTCSFRHKTYVYIFLSQFFICVHISLAIRQMFTYFSRNNSFV